MRRKAFPSPDPARRRLLGAAMAGAASLALGACSTVSPRVRLVEEPPAPPPLDPAYGSYAMMYGPVFDGGFEIPAVPIEQMDPRFLRRVVADPLLVEVDEVLRHAFSSCRCEPVVRLHLDDGRAGRIRHDPAGNLRRRQGAGSR